MLLTILNKPTEIKDFRGNPAKSTRVFDLLYAKRKHSRVDYTVDDVANVCYTIDVINAAEEDSFMIGNEYPISSYELPKAFNALISPRRISWNPTSVMFPNLVNSPSPAEGTGRLLSPSDFKVVINSILSSFNKDDMVQESIKREDVALNLDVLSKSIYHCDDGIDYVNYEPSSASKTPFIPYDLTLGLENVGAYKSMYYTKLEDMLIDWLFTAINSLG